MFALVLKGLTTFPYQLKERMSASTGVLLSRSLVRMFYNCRQDKKLDNQSIMRQRPILA